MNEIENYIDTFPEPAKTAMAELCRIIRKTAPEAGEKISYGMPAFEWNGPLVYFGGFKNHVGLYALPSGNRAFQEELKGYKTGKGSIQFPLDKPMPLELVEKIVRFRMQENLEKMNAKKIKK